MEIDLEEVARPIPMPMPYPSIHANKQPAKVVQPTPAHPPLYPSHHAPVPVRVTRHEYGQNSDLSAMLTNSDMKNPERVKYLMRTGHRATRDSGDAPAPLAAASLNSTGALRKQAQAIERTAFEDDVNAQVEVDSRVKHAVKAMKLVDFSPTEQRYANLVALDVSPITTARVPRKPSPSSREQTQRARPQIAGPCFPRNPPPRKEPITRSAYVPPVTTPECVVTRGPSWHTYSPTHSTDL